MKRGGRERGESVGYWGNIKRVKRETCVGGGWRTRGIRLTDWGGEDSQNSAVAGWGEFLQPEVFPFAEQCA